MEETTSSEQTRAAVDPGDQPLNPDEEIAEIEKLLAAEPDDFQARCRLGELYFSKGRLDDALVEVKKSIEMAEGIRAEMNRSLAMYYSNLGTIYATKNMADEAEAEFKRALDVFQYDVLALFNLGRLCADKKKYMDAWGPIRASGDSIESRRRSCCSPTPAGCRVPHRRRRDCTRPSDRPA